MRLEGKTAIVIGAGQSGTGGLGNGRATALLFARHGAKLLLVDRDEASLLETQRLITAAGGNALAHVADVTLQDACRGLIELAVGELGRVDILHNNVGIGAGDSDLLSLDEAAWDNILNVNLKSAMLPCKHVVPVMRQQQSGSIINISSLAAVAAATELTAYKVSKAGLNALTQSLAIANASYGIRVNAIAPGLIETPMAIEGIAKKRGIPVEVLVRERNGRVPLRGKMGTAWDVAHAALFLASEESHFITGIVLPVDGGQSARIG